MPYRLLIIEHDDALAGTSVHTNLIGDSAFTCRLTRWGEVGRQSPCLGEEDSIVAVAASLDSAQATEAFARLREDTIGTPIVGVLSRDADESLLRSIVCTADEFVFYPLAHVDELRHRLRRLLAEPRHELATVRRRLQEQMGLTHLVGTDPTFLRAIEQLPRFARADAPILIAGETGTGKELCARAVHQLSARRAFPFIAVDCGAVPEQLFENELFGHARGAFTDAHRDYRGLVAMAEGGSLFLDEIDALSLAAQAKLLRFLQERTYRPLGSDRQLRADVKVIAATNRDLEGCVRDKQFRSDLYFRLNVLRIQLPPLRERRGDIELLAYSILEDGRGTADRSPRTFSPSALRMLMLHDWPGNVRELCNVVQRSVVTCDGETILPSHIGILPGATSTARHPGGHFRAARAAVVAAFERHYIAELLRKHDGNVTHAAREARQDRRAFGRFIKKYQIDRRAP